MTKAQRTKLATTFKTWASNNGLTVVAPLDEGKPNTAACWIGAGGHSVTVRFTSTTGEAQFVAGPYEYVMSQLGGAL